MKKIVSSLAFLFLCIAAFGQHLVHGTITDGNGQPVANQLVNIMVDSNTTTSYYSAHPTTNVHGEYSETLPGTIPSGVDLLVSTNTNCSGTLTHTYTYAGADITSDFVLCFRTISGQIGMGNAITPAYPATVYFITKTPDSLHTGNYILRAIDSTVTDATGAYSYRYTHGDSILVKAALTPANPDFSNYLPTYYTSSIIWSGATMVAVGTTTTTVDINLIGGTNPGGPGFISGSVLQGANRITGIGDPLDNRILILTDMSNNPIAYAYGGYFSFHVPYGTYLLFGDAMGKQNPPLTVTVDASNSNVTGIIFAENITSFTGHLHTTGVASVQSSLNNVTVFPNPATDQINVSGLDNIQGQKHVVLRSISGAVVYSNDFDGASTVIPVADLAKGIYLLQVNTTEGIQNFKITK